MNIEIPQGNAIVTTPEVKNPATIAVTTLGTAAPGNPTTTAVGQPPAKKLRQEFVSKLIILIKIHVYYYYVTLCNIPLLFIHVVHCVLILWFLISILENHPKICFFYKLCSSRLACMYLLIY